MATLDSIEVTISPNEWELEEVACKAEREYLRNPQIETTIARMLKPVVAQLATKEEYRAKERAELEARRKLERQAARVLKDEKFENIESIKEVHDNLSEYNLAANASLMSSRRGGVYSSASTGTSQLFKEARNTLGELDGSRKQRRKENRKALKDMSAEERAKRDLETRDCAIHNATREIIKRGRVLLDEAYMDGVLHMGFRTVTFALDMSYNRRVDFIKRVLFLYRQKYSSALYLGVWGYGTTPLLKNAKGHEAAKSKTQRKYMTLHYHFMCNKGDKYFDKCWKKVAESERFAGYVSHCYESNIPRKSMTSRLHAAAIYFGLNVKDFTSSEITKANSGLYTQEAVDKLMNLHKTNKDFKLYTASRALNQKLRELTTNVQIPILKTGQSALSQTILYVSRRYKKPIEEMDIGTSPEGDKFYFNHDEATVASHGRIKAQILREIEESEKAEAAGVEPRNGYDWRNTIRVPYGMFLAWSLYQETDYQVTESFWNFVNDNPVVKNRLEKARLERSTRHVVDATEDEREFSEELKKEMRKELRKKQKAKLALKNKELEVEERRDRHAQSKAGRTYSPESILS